MRQFGRPETQPYRYSQLIFHKGTKEIQVRKSNLFNKIVLEQLGLHEKKKLNLGTGGTPFTKINSSGS